MVFYNHHHLLLGWLKWDSQSGSGWALSEEKRGVDAHMCSRYMAFSLKVSGSMKFDVIVHTSSTPLFERQV